MITDIHILSPRQIFFFFSFTSPNPRMAYGHATYVKTDRPLPLHGACTSEGTRPGDHRETCMTRRRTYIGCPQHGSPSAPAIAANAVCLLAHAGFVGMPRRSYPGISLLSRFSWATVTPRRGQGSASAVLPPMQPRRAYALHLVDSRYMNRYGWCLARSVLKQ